MTALSDEELIARYQEAGGRPLGTPFAEELFRRHYSRVALWCFRVAGDRDGATDLAQDVFAKAWSHLDSFRAESRFSTWLFMIARNHCFNALRSKSRLREDSLDAESFTDPTGQAPGFDSDLERQQLLTLGRSLMVSELTPLESQVMTLHFAQEMPLSAIARLLRLDNPSGAKAYIVSAKRKLKSALSRLQGADRP